jgi:hypothetical protein
VENWQMASLINLPHDPRISNILNSTPKYVILSQPAAVIIHGAMALQARLEPDEATETFEGALSKWAGNFDVNGALKSKASLTLQERTAWHAEEAAEADEENPAAEQYLKIQKQIKQASPC